MNKYCNKQTLRKISNIIKAYRVFKKKPENNIRRKHSNQQSIRVVNRPMYIKCVRALPIDILKTTENVHYLALAA